MTEPDEIDRQLDERLAAETPGAKEEEKPKKASYAIKKCIDKLNDIRAEDRLLVEEFRGQIKVVLGEEMAVFKKQLSEEMREANRVFLRSFREQTERVLLQSAKAAATKTRAFVLSQMQSVSEGDEGE